MKSVLSRHWFLISLAIVLFVGLFAPPSWHALADNRTLRNGIVFSVLLITGLSLSSTAVWQAIRRPTYALLAVLVNYGFIPLAAWGLSSLLSGELAVGLIVVAIAPSTVASAAVWTRKAGGNDAVAVMVTVITNMSCFLFIPFWLAITSQGMDVELDPVALTYKLALMVVLPMIIGQALRRSGQVATWADSHKSSLSTACQCGVLSIVLMGAIRCGIQLETIGLGRVAGSVLVMLVLVVILHLAALGVGYWLSGLARFERPNRIAVTIAGSQKTLLVGLHVALMVGGGLTVLPMVSYHVAQLLIDTVVADRFSAGERRCLP
jgi:sodium/bile acid cotransporter 7